jgi:hypothetical protein
MQKLLHEGENDLGFRDECVPTPARQNLKFSPFARETRSASPSGLAFPRLVRRHVRRAVPEYGEYPQVPQPPACSQNKKSPGGTPWAARRLRDDGHRLRCVGVTLWATPTPPPPLHCTGLGTRRCTGRRTTAICRPSMRSSTPAQRWTSRPTATSGGIFVRRVGACQCNAAVARRQTPLHMAAYKGDAKATAALLGAGADASIQDWAG